MTDRHDGLTRPTTRVARLSAIEQALATHIVTSQSKLSDMLADEGIEVTQATLSRDLEELHASKTRLADGTIAYTLADSAPGGADVGSQVGLERQVAHAISGLVTSVAASLNLVVVHTPAGAAQYVASVIDRHPLDGVLGTIAGDDTVLLVCADPPNATSRCRWLVQTVSKTPAEGESSD